MATMPLPLPRSGSITHIIHLADVHVRGGDDEVARRVEYADVFDSLLASLAGMPAVLAGSAVVIMAGDLIHSRRAAEASTIAQLNDLFRRLSMLAPVYVFSGNHESDAVALSEAGDAYSTLDVLGSQVRSAIAWIEQAGGHCQLAYLEHSGLYRAGNVGFGFVAMKDSLRAGNARGYERDLCPFPSAADLPADVTHRFALFHGTITCKNGGNGRPMSGVALDWFGEAGYDGCILGDYHVQMVRNADELPPAAQETLRPSHNAGVYQLPPPSSGPLVWAYPGSTVCQDMGEGLFGHGFLTWDLPGRRVSRYHVPNARGLVTVRRAGDDPTAAAAWVMCTGRSCDRAAWMSPARAVASLAWLPSRLTVRVTGHSTSACDVAQADAVLREAGFEVERIYHQDFVEEDRAEQRGEADSEHGRSMAFYNTPDAWVEHVAACNDQVPLDDLLGGLPWRVWLREPDLMQAPELPAAVSALMTAKAGQAGAKRHLDIAAEAARFRDASARNGEAMRRSPLKLVSMAWRYMLCYGTHNWLDFRSMTGHVVLLSGQNSAGKSSILEIVCWGVFGAGIPSRDVKSQSAAVVCTGRKHGERATVSAVLDVGGEMYRIHRPIDVKEATCGTSSNEATVSRLTTDDDGDVHAHEVASGRTAVRDWVSRHVGDIASFLASTMLTQHGDNCFFSKTGKEQVEQIDEVLGNAVIVSATDVTHMACVAHQALLNDVDLLQSAVTKRVPSQALEGGASDVAALEGARAALTARVAALEGRWRASAAAWATVDPALGQRILGGEAASLSCELSQLLCHGDTTCDAIDARVTDLELRLRLVLHKRQDEASGADAEPVASGATAHELRRELAQWRARPPDVAEPSKAEGDVRRMEDEERDWARTWAPITCGNGDAHAASTAERAATACDQLTLACRHASSLATRHELLSAEAAGEEERVGESPSPPDAAGAPEEDPAASLGRLEEALRRRETLRRAVPARPRRTRVELEGMRRAVAAECDDGPAESDVPARTLAAEARVTACLDRRVAASRDLAAAELAARLAEEEQETCRASTDAHIRTRPAHASPPPDVERAREAWRAAASALQSRAVAMLLLPPPSSVVASLAGEELERQVRVWGDASSSTLGQAATLQHRMDARALDTSAARARLSLAAADTPDFNPECAACRKQPWKVQLDRMRGDLEASDRQLAGLEQELRRLLGSSALEGLRRSVRDSSEWLTEWRASGLEGDEGRWAQRLAASRAWDTAHTALRGIQDDAGARRTAARCRATASRAAADAASTACDLARGEVDRLQGVTKRIVALGELAEAEAYDDWGLQLAAHDAACGGLTERHDRCTRWAAWRRAVADWGDRRDTIARVVAGLRDQLQAAGEALDRARLAEVGARSASGRATEGHTRAELFLHERERVWRPLATSLASERAAWAAWGPWRRQEAALTRAAEALEARDAREELEDARRTAGAVARRTRLHRAVTVGVPAHASQRAAEEGLEAARGELRVLDERLGGARGAAREHASDLALIRVMAAYCGTLRQRLTALRWLEAGMAGYRSWLYGKVIGPRLQHEVNVNLALLQGDAPDMHRIGLVGTWQDARGAFLWEMSDGAVGTVARGKGGGFQRASIGMCMRLALARISVVGTVSRHLFIDEGFTASDSANMARVPRFLAGLLPRFDSITLVSHIESLKEAASMAIRITRYRDEGGKTLSRVQHGREGGEAAPPPKKTGRPRKCRTGADPAAPTRQPELVV